MAPEVINGRYSQECDLWAIGCIMYILLSGFLPFNGENKAEIFKKIKKA
jgi:calcium-dependent protein kinase